MFINLIIQQSLHVCPQYCFLSFSVKKLDEQKLFAFLKYCVLKITFTWVFTSLCTLFFRHIREVPVHRLLAQYFELEWLGFQLSMYNVDKFWGSYCSLTCNIFDGNKDEIDSRNLAVYLYTTLTALRLNSLLKPVLMSLSLPALNFNLKPKERNEL